MQTFSLTLFALYDIAASASLSEFPVAALRLFHDCINFDGAILGMGESDPASILKIADAYIDGRDPSIVEDYAQVSAKDPITQAFVDGLTAPLQSDCRVAYRSADLRELDGFARKHGLRHLMLYGDRPGGDNACRWIVLYKNSDHAFTPDEEVRLQYLWPHLTRTIGINRSRVLERLDPRRRHRSFALLNGRGAIEAADPDFLVLQQLEWPNQSTTRLSHAVLDCLMRTGKYRGRCIEITMTPQSAYLVCRARAITEAAITPREYAVARRFAEGLSHKEIAREQGVSQHTVRAHLANVYEKLGVHNKVSLAHYLAKCR